MRRVGSTVLCEEKGTVCLSSFIGGMVSRWNSPRRSVIKQVNGVNKEQVKGRMRRVMEHPAASASDLRGKGSRFSKWKIPSTPGQAGHARIQ